MLLIQIVVFLLLLGLLYLPFRTFKISDKTRYLVYLVLFIGLIIIVFIDPAFDNKFVILPLFLPIAGIVRKLKQLTDKN